MPPRKRPRLEPRQRRRLPDLCLIALFKQLKPKDQINASRMNSRCAMLVRAANRRVRTLIITTENVEFKNVKRSINSFSLASKPIMQQLADVNELSLVCDYPMTKRINKWNCLNICDLPTAEELVTIFSAVTDFKFVPKVRLSKKHSQYLVDLLRHPGWAGQLTSFMFPYFFKVTVIVFAAINNLSALKYLAIDFGSKILIPELPILAQLKVIVVKVRYEKMSQFLRTLECHAAANDALRVHLLLHDDIRFKLNILEPLCSRIARFGRLDYNAVNVALYCLRFTSLTSVNVYNLGASNVGPLFTALSQLQQLVHLELEMNLCKLPLSSELPWSSRPQAQLKSVRAIDLHLTISSHSDVQWLNLQQTLPHLQAIHLQYFNCRSCQVSNYSFIQNCYAISSKVCQCLRESLLPHLHLGVHPGHTFIKRDNNRSPFFSFEQL